MILNQSKNNVNMKTNSLISLLLFLTLTISSLHAQEKEKVDDKTKKVTFVTSIDCDGCVNTIMSNIPKEKGVKNVVCDLKTKKVTITYKKQKTDPEKLKRSLEKIGYKADKLEKDPAGKIPDLF